ERLPYPDGVFDLVASTTSFDHWADQRAGLGECARVLVPGGHLLLADLFSPWLVPTLLGGRRGKARTRQRARRLLSAAGVKDLAVACPLRHHPKARDGNALPQPGEARARKGPPPSHAT